MGPDDEHITLDTEALKKLKHDIRNQLSNINLALEQLQYEMPETTMDGQFYMNIISTSSNKINELLGEREVAQ